MALTQSGDNGRGGVVGAAWAQWASGLGSTFASRVTLTVGFEMGRGGRVSAETMRWYGINDRRIVEKNIFWLCQPDSELACLL